MSTQITTTSLQRALAFVFRDKKWGTKILVAGLLTLLNGVIPIIPALLLLGYEARVMRRIAVEDGEAALPEWNDWGDMLIDGLRLLGINILYYLPGVVFIIIGYIAVLISAGRGNWEASSSAAGPVIAMVVMWFLMGIGTLLIMAALFFSGPAMVHAIAKKRFGAAFEFSSWWKVLRANWGGFFLAFILIFGLSQLMSGVLAITIFTVCLICLAPIIIIAVGIYTRLVTAALYGMAYREGADKLASAASASATATEDEKTAVVTG